MTSEPAEEWRKLDNLASIALREAWLWGQAVFKLGSAISRSRDGVASQVDAMLLAVASRSVYRAADMANRTRREPDERLATSHEISFTRDDSEYTFVVGGKELPDEALVVAILGLAGAGFRSGGKR